MKGVSFSDPFYSGSVHIVSGQIASGTTGTAGTLLQIDKDTGCFTAYDFSQPCRRPARRSPPEVAQDPLLGLVPAGDPNATRRLAGHP